MNLVHCTATWASLQCERPEGHVGPHGVFLERAVWVMWNDPVHTAQQSTDTTLRDTDDGNVTACTFQSMSPRGRVS